MALLIMQWVKYKLESVTHILHPLIPVIKKELVHLLPVLLLTALCVGLGGSSRRCLPVWSTLLVLLSRTTSRPSVLVTPPEFNGSFWGESCSRTLSAFRMRRSFRVSLPRVVLLVLLRRLTWEKAHSSLPFDTGREKRRVARQRMFGHSEEFGAWNSRHHTD